ncbi:hypothetical protein EXZ48_03375 [Shinella sp. JR1-6]|nr:hypothetical protein EXZ48_03375 [Shinella sp. JR1-6]
MRRRLPLTLTLSPQAGRGDLPHEPVLIAENGAAYPLRPVYGEKVAGRPDEGPAQLRMPPPNRTHRRRP